LIFFVFCHLFFKDGPVLNEWLDQRSTRDLPNAGKLNRPLALRWNALDDTDSTIEGFLDLGTATTTTEFLSATSKMQIFDVVLTFAERNTGDIAYAAVGTVPRRKPGHSGLFPVAGNGDWDWIEYIPWNEMPKMVNPPQGFIVTANNLVVRNSTESDYRNIDFARWYTHRAYRITDVISKHIARDEPWTNTHTRRLMLDVYNVFYKQDMAPILEQMRPSDDEVETWRQNLIAWDGQMNPDSEFAAVAVLWWSELSRLPSKSEVDHPHWRERGFVINSILQSGGGNDRACLAWEGTDSCLAFAEQALARAVETYNDHGKGTWADWHPQQWRHQMLQLIPFLRDMWNRESPSRTGDFTTVAPGQFLFPEQSVDPKRFFETSQPSRHKFLQYFGAIYRSMTDLADVEQRSWFMLPPGQLENPMHPWYDNLLKDYWDQDEDDPVWVERMANIGEDRGEHLPRALNSKLARWKKRGYETQHALNLVKGG
jgi:penicillin amidase